MLRQPWIAFAAFFGATAVAAAAYTAHGLGFIEDLAARETTRVILHTAVQQQFFHALALLGVGVLSLRAEPKRWLLASGILFTVGIVLFSGLIYLRVFTGVQTLRFFVPWGGVCLMLGWAALGIAGTKLAGKARGWSV